jgi:hypothetical protein
LNFQASLAVVVMVFMVQSSGNASAAMELRDRYPSLC